LSIVRVAPIRHAARGRPATRQCLAVAFPDLAAADLEQLEDFGREFLGAAVGTSAFVVLAHGEGLKLSIDVTLA
jgi:hypothetical protein